MERNDGGISCSQVLEELSAYVDGELDSEHVDKIESHLLSCTNCKRFGTSFGGMVVSLRQSRSTELSEDLVHRISAGLDDG